MSIYLLQLVGKWISLLVISIASFCGSINLKEESIDINNVNNNKNLNIINTLVEYKTITNYTNRLPYKATKTLVKGEDGIVYKNDNGNIEKTIRKMTPEVIEVGTGPNGKYIGKMTGYGPDCYGCSKVGNVACHTEKRTKHSLINDSIYYEDDEYGKIRILAAETNIFPCGTIIEVDNGNIEPFIGVVLDSGGAMRNAWSLRQEILVDLAFATESDPDVSTATSRNVTFNVQRWGW